MFSVPILVITYHRVETAHNLFQVLKKIQPERLYVAGDGGAPTDKNDFRLCLKARCVFMPDWPCKLNTMFLDEHLGKAKMFVKAMNWFFEQEEEGIILFDDAFPHIDFFQFCQQMLDTYRDDLRIGHIGATNVLKKESKDANSYYFSAYPSTWGFATWKNRFSGFDLNMRDLDTIDLKEILSQYTLKRKVRSFWIRNFRILQNGQYNVWEYQYIYHIWKNGFLCIVPNVNLVQNTRFQTKKRKLRKLNRPLKAILPLKMNLDVVQNADADQFVFRKYYRRDVFAVIANWLKTNLLLVEDGAQVITSTKKIAH